MKRLLLITILFVAGHAFAASCSNNNLTGGWTCISSSSAFSAGSASSIATGNVSGVVAGSTTILVTQSQTSVGDCQPPTDGFTSIWTTIAWTPQVWNSSSAILCAYAAIPSSTGSDSILCNFTLNGTNNFCAAYVLSGGDSFNPPQDQVVATIGNTSSGTNNMIAASVLTTFNGDLVIGVPVSAAGAAITPSAGYSQFETSGSVFKVQASVGSIAVTATDASTRDNYALGVITLKNLAAANSPTPSPVFAVNGQLCVTMTNPTRRVCCNKVAGVFTKPLPLYFNLKTVYQGSILVSGCLDDRRASR